MAIACAKHPGTDASWACKPCGRALCGGCVKTIQNGARILAQCADCGALALSIDDPKAQAIGREVARALRPASLVDRLPGTLAYLKDPGLLLGLIGLAFLAWVFRFGGLLALLGLGIEAAFYFHIVASSADGHDSFDVPALDDVWEEIFAPLARYLAALIPLIAALVWFGLTFVQTLQAGVIGAVRSPGDMIEAAPLPAAAVLLAVLLWPLLTVIAALQKSVVSVLNPIVWVRMLRVLKTDYVIAAALFYGLLFVEAMVLAPIAWWLESHIPIPIVGPVAGIYVVYLSMALRGRILGEMCRPYMD